MVVDPFPFLTKNMEEIILAQNPFLYARIAKKAQAVENPKNAT